MGDSIWKKEISFKRAPKADVSGVEPAAAEPVEDAKQSFLKKEISFSRKPKAPKEPKAAKEPKAPKEPKAAKPQKESVLKKEISFSRKPKAPKAPAQEKQEKSSSSFLKKEISFSRKNRDRDRDREIERLVEEAAQAVSPTFTSVESVEPVVADTSPTTLAEAAVATMAQASDEQVPVEQPPAAHDEYDVVAPAPSFLEHTLARPLPPVAEDIVPADLQLVEPLPVELHPSGPAPVEALGGAPTEELYAVPTLPLAEIPVAAAPELAAPEVAADPSYSPAEPPPAPDVQPEPQVPAAVLSEPEPAEPWLAAPELPPAPEAPAAVVVHPPVAAADLPPIAAEVGLKTPFWKKELSLSRKAKTPKPPKAERAPKPATASAPFWKKELSLGRKPKPAAAVPPADERPAADAPAADRAPFWKKQVAFSMPSFSLPSRGSSGGHGAKKLVGLKIGASQLAAARISNNGFAELQQIAREPLAAGIVVGGELRDPGALGDALKAFFAKNKLPRKGVRLGIASNRIGVRIFEIVGVEQDKQLANAVQFRAQEALPIPLDEAVLDYQVLDESVDDEGQNVKRVLLVVAYRELVDRYVSACRQAGITLAGIDLEAFALLRALAVPTAGGDAACVAVAIGHDRSTFAVSDGRVCEFTRVLEWGGWSINVALARVFDSTPSEVEAIKRGLSLDGGEAPPGLTEAQAALALDAVRRQVQSFARELVSSLQFYQSQPGSRGIGEILLTGGTAELPGLAPELERLIGVHVRVGDPLLRLKIPKRLENTEQLGSYAVAIGLAIED